VRERGRDIDGGIGRNHQAVEAGHLEDDHLAQQAPRAQTVFLVEDGFH
jgi:hypothetical protein